MRIWNTEMNEYLRSAAGALCLAVIYVSSVELISLISYMSEVGAVIYGLLIAVLYFLTLISPNKKQWLLKYLLSIPFSFVVFGYFNLTDYSVRALNWVKPGYGRFSAGGNFARLFMAILFSAVCLVAVISSLFIKPQKDSSFKKIQNVVCVASTILIVISVLYLQMQFPEKILVG